MRVQNRIHKRKIIHCVTEYGDGKHKTQMFFMGGIPVGVALERITMFSITHNSLFVRMFIVWQLCSLIIYLRKKSGLGTSLKRRAHVNEIYN